MLKKESKSTMLLVGSGPMAVEYAKVLKACQITPLVLGRGKVSAEKFTVDTGLPVILGGIEAWLEDPSHKLPDRACIAVGEKSIGTIAKDLMTKGVRHLLLEKPGGYDAADIHSVYKHAERLGAIVYVGYNRRFYASVAAAKKIIVADGGVTSFNFEFTEWGHIIADLHKETGVKEQWFLSNSTHVIDLAFYLGGVPKELCSYTTGGLDWHPTASIFGGAGISQSGAIFSYQANWEAPGRWGVEVLTRKHRIILRPLEKIQVQKIGSIAVETIEIDDALDKEFKPGLYNQVLKFIRNDVDGLPTISDQVKMLEWYLKIRGDNTNARSLLA